MILFQPYITGAKLYPSLGIHVPFGPTYYSELRGEGYDWRGHYSHGRAYAQAWFRGDCLIDKKGEELCSLKG